MKVSIVSSATSFAVIAPAMVIAVLAPGGGVAPARAQTGDPGLQTTGGGETPALALTAAQRRAIYVAVGNDRTKTAKQPFPAAVGADVPPMLELYTLPDQVLAENRAASFYQYTLVQNKVVLVDPTRMRVVDVIGPPGR